MPAADDKAGRSMDVKGGVATSMGEIGMGISLMMMEGSAGWPGFHGKAKACSREEPLIEEWEVVDDEVTGVR